MSAKPEQKAATTGRVYINPFVPNQGLKQDQIDHSARLTYEDVLHAPGVENDGEWEASCRFWITHALEETFGISRYASWKGPILKERIGTSHLSNAFQQQRQSTTLFPLSISTRARLKALMQSTVPYFVTSLPYPKTMHDIANVYGYFTATRRLSNCLPLSN